jgi:thiol-disulfide isomerase/thioredoxin
VNLVLLLLRLVLALVFLSAAGAKALGHRYVAVLSERFSLPRRLAPVVALLPLIEAAAGASLLFPRTFLYGARACVALLVVFSALLVRNRVSGRRGACGCFGEHGRSLADRWPLWRNGALLAVAVVVSLGHARTQFWVEVSRLGPWRSAPLLLAVVALVGAVTVPVQWLRPGRRRAALDLPLTAFDGSPTTLGILGARRPTMVLFLAPGCGACRSLLEKLRSHNDDPAGRRLVVAAPSAAASDDEFVRAVASASAAVVDDGALTELFGVPGTPSVVELGPGGRHLGTVVGVHEVAAALGWDHPLQAPRSAGRVVLDRRRALALGFGAMALPVLVLRRPFRLFLAARVTGGSGGRVYCPSCGSCSVCTYDASSRKLKCRPCQQACSGKKLCASYANQLPAFRALSTWLAGRGFHQSAEPFTLGMEQAGKLTILSSLTPFSGTSRTTPKALLVYDLTDSGERAWAALLDERGHFVEVAGVSSGRVVSSPVPQLRSAASASAPAHHSAVGELGEDVPAALPDHVATGYACSDLCGFALGVGIALATLPAAVVAAPEWVAVGFAASLFSSGLGLMGASTASTAAGVLAPLVLSPLELGGTLVNGVIDGAASFGTGLGQSALCNELCKLETEYCCNYGCGCFKDYHACLSACPLDLKHPMAACNTYRRFGPKTHWVQVTGIPSKCKV